MKRSRFIVCGIVAAAIAIGLAWPWLFLYAPLGNFEKEKSNVTIGEAYEVLGAVFTLLAFVGVIVTLQVQHEEANAQRRDAEVGEIRSEFFQLVRAWQDIIHHTSFAQVDSMARGRQAFEKMSA